MRLRPAHALTVLTALALAGCTAGGGDDAEKAPETEETASPQETVEELESAAGEEEPVAIEPLSVIATRATSDGDVSAEVDLNAVTVSGDVMTVLFTVRNLSDGKWQLSHFFDDGSAHAPLADGDTETGSADPDLGFTTDGVTVVDTANGLLHRAAYDDTGTCACSSGLSSKFVGGGEQMVLTTAFTAPPEDVTHVTVQIPGVGSFDDVELTR
ncbi:MULTISPECIES: hypothetical protein [unclassified Actinotalea]|uniref:hypothetical protein n=1 Tax=unclassified Actinotalea TaxID=2638618 RepID=UPI0015F6A598|nr:MULTISPECIES: hypothetical protein [unclassified Actinotalea]